MAGRGRGGRDVVRWGGGDQAGGGGGLAARAALSDGGPWECGQVGPGLVQRLKGRLFPYIWNTYISYVFFFFSLLQRPKFEKQIPLKEGIQRGSGAHCAGAPVRGQHPREAQREREREI